MSSSYQVEICADFYVIGAKTLRYIGCYNAFCPIQRVFSDTRFVRDVISIEAHGSFIP